MPLLWELAPLCRAQSVPLHKAGQAGQRSKGISFLEKKQSPLHQFFLLPGPQGFLQLLKLQAGHFQL